MNFSISEFCISRLAIPQAVADKILKYHIVPMQTIRTKRGIRYGHRLTLGIDLDYTNYEWGEMDCPNTFSETREQ